MRTGHKPISIKRGGEWYLEKRGSRKILAGSRNLGAFLISLEVSLLHGLLLLLFSLKTFYQRVSGLDSLTRISASRRVPDFTIFATPIKNIEKSRK